jgi:hypothetical protein
MARVRLALAASLASLIALSGHLQPAKAEAQLTPPEPEVAAPAQPAEPPPPVPAADIRRVGDAVASLIVLANRYLNLR